MPTEFTPTSPESAERNQAELDKLGSERLEQLQDSPESNVENDPSKRAEAAREKINRQEVIPEPVPAAEIAPHNPSIAAHLDRLINYTQTLLSVQRRLNPASRAFSRIIHTPAIEKSSEALETTIMRPSVITGALWAAVIVGAVFYFTARHFGYQTSGSEMLAALLMGAIIGFLIEKILHRSPR